jgi:hypothetical protein
MTIKKPVFILSFFRIYWPLLIVFAGFTALGRWDRLVYFIGPVFYVLNLLLAALVGALFIKHVCFRASIDAYTQKKDDDGIYSFAREFFALPPEQRVFLTIATVVCLFLGACWICAAIAK